MEGQGRAGGEDGGGREEPFEAPFGIQGKRGKQGKRAGILIGTSRLSASKHAGK